MNIPYIYKSGRNLILALGLLLSTVSQAQNLSLVGAELDYAHTLRNSSVLVDALANDKNKDGAYIDKIVLTNHCTATIEDGQVRITPEEDFKGVALVRYTVKKNDIKNNDCGLIVVDVAANPLPYYYKFNLFVLKNSKTQFTLPVNYVKSRDPRFGRIVPIKPGVWEFQALANDNGYDDIQFTYTANGQTRLHEVHFDVLKDLQTAVNNDFFSTMIGKKIVVDVLKNDDKTDYKEITIGNAVGGTVSDLLNGKVEFTPALRETGVATFEYFFTKQSGNVEKGTVQIFVSNFHPAKDVYQITTTGVPTLIRYAAPVEGYTLEVLNTQSGSPLKFFANIDTILEGRPLKGKHVLLYQPLPNTESDVFYAKYCPNNGSNCSGYFKVNILIQDEGVSGSQLCGSDCVIPGDANNDGEVNILDIFPIGINMGSYGPARNSASDFNPLQWYPRKAEDWDGTIGIDNPNNMKHADTDGDGVITIGDVDAIRENYGKHNAIIPTISIANSDVTVEATTSLTSVGPGDLIEFLISMGTPLNPAYKAKGLTFTVNYEADQIQDNSLSVDFGGFNWLSRYDAFLPFDAQRERGIHDAGMVRTKDNGTSGHGVVGKVRAIVISDDVIFRLAAKSNLKMRLTDIKMLTESGAVFALPETEIEVPIVLRKKEDKIKNDDLITYPNPAKGQVNFHLNGINTIEYVRLMDVTGREVLRVNVDAKAAQLQTGGLSNGLYIAEVMTEKGRIMRKVEIMK
jgi:hypothetical protein